MKNYILKIKNKIKSVFVTILQGSGKISQTRDIATPESRDITKPKLIMESLTCPYCQSKEFVRKGFRNKKREIVQLYRCKACGRVFTPRQTKGKHYPLGVMLKAISIYNSGYSLEKTCQIINEEQQKTRFSADSLTGKHTDVVVPALSKNKVTYKQEFVKSHLLYTIQPSTLSTWLKETEELCKFSRMREFVMKKYKPEEMVVSATLAHQQLFHYRFHRAKCQLIINEDFKHYRFGPLQEFLEMVPGECPHQYFSTGLRASEAPMTFSKKQMIVRAKQNYANQLAQFVLQSVKERQLRHEALQKFMLYNDSVTVATEVPVYLTKDDLEHLQTQLGFELYQKTQKTQKAGKSEKSDDQKISNSDALSSLSLPRLITGHIDILQIRNGQIHILDYKPRAEKEKPIEQLTLYAMALSRLTGLRMFDFKCAWFDENDYFEFYPLHVIHKPKKRQWRKKIRTNEGIYLINQIKEKIARLRPL